ncbi:MAG: hypothetical protein GEV28_12165 [Actinophytocola sp.]|uniref:tetratricopeptide repeat protein n=1 Tax=Actinophytocola sp. TaxID=1872138 RepID=UPI001329659C|nr:hypothetical protein [Actinophytocola sp.]MPZ81097.1 hypothetical protein [Actinophytocola sp.]
MPEPPDAAPHEPGAPEARSRDPFAVALGNASLLGVGYVLLGRRGLAAVAVTVSLGLLAVLAFVEGAGWFQGVVFAWWAAVAVHGFYLATSSRTRPSGVRAQRLVAAAAAVPVLATFVVLRVDAAQKESAADEAHRAGECAQVLSIVDGLGPAQRLADAPLVDRANDGAEACELVVRARRQAKDDRLLAARTIARYQDHRAARWAGAADYRADLLLDQAAENLRAALTGDVDALGAGFDLLRKIRGEFRDRTSDADGVLADFLGGLPVEDPCVTLKVTDWIGRQQARGSTDLRRAEGIVDEVAPAALVGCADRLLAANNPSEALKGYQRLVTDYPEHTLAARAEKGITAATYAIQLRDVRTLLTPPYGGELPPYCTTPKPYGGAKPYRGRGPHRTMLFGQDHHRDNLPAPWRATDDAAAVLVICAGAEQLGDVVETCTYEPVDMPGGYRSVTFHKYKVPVRVYEVRTGRLVANTTVQIGGTSCPYFLYGLPADEYVSPTTADIRAAYQGLITP